MTVKESALDRMLKFHKQSCAMHTYSLQNKRHCSCGRDEALKEVEELRRKIQELQRAEVA